MRDHVTTNKVDIYVRLQHVFPCVPQELVLRQYANSFGFADLAPTSLVEALFPLNLTEVLANDTVSCAAMNTLKSNRAMRLPPVPRENIRENRTENFASRRQGVHSMFSFTRMSESKITAAVFVDCATDDEAGVLCVGYNTGAVLLWNMKLYGAYLSKLRLSDVADAASAAATATKLWGNSQPPEGVELLGYHLSGNVMSAVDHSSCSVLVTGSADGSLYLWDAYKQYTDRYNSSAEYDPTLNAAQRFSQALRNRKLCRAKTRVHNGSINALGVLRELLISGSVDCLVKTWQFRYDVRSLPDYVPIQSFNMHGWVRSIHVTLPYDVHVDDFVATDDCGFVTGFKRESRMNSAAAASAEVTLPSFVRAASTAASAAAAERASRRGSRVGSSVGSGLLNSHSQLDEPKESNAPAERGPNPPCTKFVPHRTQRILSEETNRIRANGMTQGMEATNTMISIYPFMSYSSALLLNYSSVMRVLDYSKLSVTYRLPHPTLTPAGAELDAGATTSVNLKEHARREAMFGVRQRSDSNSILPHAARPASARASGNRLATAASNTAEARSTTPLRFIDALYVPSHELFLLLDSRNTVFVWDCVANSFLTKSAASVITDDDEHKAAVRLLPCGHHCFSEDRHSSRNRTSRSQVDQQDLSIPFFVVYTTGVDLCCVVPTSNPVLEIPAHPASMVGIRFLSATPEPVQLGGLLPAVAERDNIAKAFDRYTSENCLSLVSVSVDGTVMVWGSPLRHLRTYRPDDCEVVSVAAVEKSTAMCNGDARGRRGGGGAACGHGFSAGTGAPVRTSVTSEVTAVTLCERWALIVTGHESGDICFWSYEGELADVVVQPAAHTNSVACVTPAYLPLFRGQSNGKSEELLISGGFDGVVTTWSNPQRRGAVQKRNRNHITWNEVLCAEFVESSFVVVVGDAAGNVFFLQAKDLVVLGIRKVDISSDTALLAASSLVSLCVLDGGCLLTGSDHGELEMIQYEHRELQQDVVIGATTSQNFLTEEKLTEINSIVKVDGARALVCTRSGVLLLVQVRDGKLTTRGRYTHTSEVRGVDVQSQNGGDTFRVALGCDDGSLVVLNETFFV